MVGPGGKQNISLSLFGLSLFFWLKCSSKSCKTIDINQQYCYDLSLYRAGEDAGNFTVLSGMGANLRTALNSQNIKMYDDRTSRFDSPFQTGNCGGDGTCGTCVVAVLAGNILHSCRLFCQLRRAFIKITFVTNYFSDIMPNVII